MSRRCFAVFIALLSVISLFADPNKIYTFANMDPSPFRSVAYHGDFMDFAMNPAALPLIDDEHGSFMISINDSDDIPFAGFSEPTGYIQNRVDELNLAFAGNNVALMAILGTSFSRNGIKDNNAYFDVYSNIDINVSLAYAFPYVSLGFSLKGGNSLVRFDKHIGGVIDAMANAWFSPFERNPGSERFSLGLGLLLYFDYFSIGLNIDQILSLDSSNSITTSWERIGSSSSLSFAANGDKFTRNGDLAFILPRASISFSGFLNGRYTFSAKGDLAFQFLPDYSLSLGLGYREYNHSFFGFNGDNGIMDIYLKGNFWSLSLTLGISLDCGSFSSIAPFIGFSYIR